MSYLDEAPLRVENKDENDDLQSVIKVYHRYIKFVKSFLPNII